MDVTAVRQAEEEDIYKFICHKQGNTMTDGRNDQLSRTKAVPFMSN